MCRLQKFKILVVEDDLDLNEILCEFLATKNATVFSAFNGQEALAIHTKEQVDFILSDIQMPIMDGFTMLKNIQTGVSRNPPILFVTGDSFFTELEAKNLGALGLINKPFSKETLMQSILQKVTDDQRADSSI